MGRNRTKPRYDFRKELRISILVRDGGGCYYCGCPKATTLDHLLPVSKGGRYNLANLVVACSKCNSLKSNMTEQEFYEWLVSSDPSAARRRHRNGRKVKTIMSHLRQKGVLAP